MYLACWLVVMQTLSLSPKSDQTIPTAALSSNIPA